MSHYAYIDSHNIVVSVIHGKNDNELIEGLHPEEYYARNTSYRVKTTSPDGLFRKQYAAIGYRYDESADLFVAPQPFPSWTLDANHDWQPPKPKPNGLFAWDESQLDWVEIDPQS